MEGRMVVELRPRQVGVNKGAAVKALVDKYRLMGAIYLGDDISDVDAFRATHRKGFKGLAVGVIGEEAPHLVERKADFTLNGVGDVERFLIWLAGAVPALRQ
jgi:trehalose 6-phosphate phosphatase